MPDGSVEIKTELGTEGVEKGVKKINKEIQTIGKEAEKTTKKTAGDFKKLDTAMQEAAGTASGLASKISNAASAGSVYVAAAVGAIAATKKIGEVMRECTDAFHVQEDAENALAIAARNNPYLDGQAVAGLKAFASELQSVSEIGDEVSLKLMAQLAATGRTESQIRDIMKAAADYAAGTGTDIQSAVQTLNATFSGQAGALGRQIESIKNLTDEQLKNGDAVKLISKHYNGLASELANVKEQAENAKGDFKEMIGALIAPAVDLWDRFWKGFYEKGTAAMKWLKKRLDFINTDNDAFLHNMLERMDYDPVKEAEKQRKRDMYKPDPNDALDSGAAAYKAVEKWYKKATPTKKLEDSSIEELEKIIEQLQLKIELAGKLGEKEQELLEKSTALLAQKEKAEKDRIATENAAAKAAEDKAKAQKTADDYAKASNKQLEKNIKALELEAKAKGENVKAQDLFNVYLKSYIDLLTNTEGKIKEGYPVAQKRLEQVNKAKAAVDAQTDAEKKLKAAIEATKAVMNTIKDMKIAPTPLEGFDQQLAQYKKLQDKIKALDDATIEKAQEGNDTKYTKEQLLEQLKEKEIALEKEKIRKIAGIRKSEFDEYKAQQEQRLKLKEAIDASEVLSKEEKEKAKDEIDEKYAQAKIERARTVMEQVNQYTQQALQVAQDAAKLMLESIQNEQKLELAALDEKYEKGEMSETEYTAKMKEIKKKAAQEEYKVKMFQWTASMLAAVANIAEGVSKTIALGFPIGLATAPIVAAAGAVQIASIVASKPIPPNFAHGGIVGGSSYYGDNVNANVNSGEMITNFPQQKRLWAMLNGERQYKPSFPITVNNTQSNRVSAYAQERNGEVFIEIIDKHINKGFADGTYDRGFAGMQGRNAGVNIQ
nr:MAG TPA: tail length tape measure protein [Caudoviricetes sp.]